MAVPTRKQLKAELSKAVPPGAEAAVLAEAEADLLAAQAALAALRKERARNERAISVRERKLADWKGKIPFVGEPSPEAAVVSLQRAGVMPCTPIADVAQSPSAEERLDAESTRLVFRPDFRRALTGLAGFSHVWLITSGEGGVRASAHEVRAIDERAGEVIVGGTGVDGVVVDVKPYLAYCDAGVEGSGEDAGAG